jgi:sugar phosphate isomerase/epimerase
MFRQGELANLNRICGSWRDGEKYSSRALAREQNVARHSILIAGLSRTCFDQEFIMNAFSAEISRRNFFPQAAFFSTTALFAQKLSRADDASRAIGLGFSLYGMKTLTIDAALKALAEIGYDCTELPVMPDWPADSARLDAAARKALRDQFADRGVRLSALMENLPALGDDAKHLANLERLKRATELSRELGRDGKSPPIETILGSKPGEFDAVKGRFVERLRDWAKVAAEAQVAVAIKAHVSNATQQPEQLLWLLDQVASPWLKAAYDYSHFQLQGLEMKETMTSILPRAAFIHVKDTEHAQGKRGFLLPGEGTIDYVAMFRELGQSTYRGDVVVEVSSQVFNRPGYDPLAAASKCYNHLADAFSKSGLKRG